MLGVWGCVTSLLPLGLFLKKFTEPSTVPKYALTALHFIMLWIFPGQCCVCRTAEASNVFFPSTMSVIPTFFVFVCLLLLLFFWGGTFFCFVLFQFCSCFCCCCFGFFVVAAYLYIIIVSFLCFLLFN